MRILEGGNRREEREIIKKKFRRGNRVNITTHHHLETKKGDSVYIHEFRRSKEY